jgi:hypothetical protein
MRRIQVLENEGLLGLWIRNIGEKKEKISTTKAIVSFFQSPLSSSFFLFSPFCVLSLFAH